MNKEPVLLALPVTDGASLLAGVICIEEIARELCEDS